MVALAAALELMALMAEHQADTIRDMNLSVSDDPSEENKNDKDDWYEPPYKKRRKTGDEEFEKPLTKNKVQQKEANLSEDKRGKKESVASSPKTSVARSPSSSSAKSGGGGN